MDTEIRQIDLAEWQQVGEGGNGKTYVNPSQPDVILKVNKPRLSSRQAVEREFRVARAVRQLGIPVPEAREMVRVGEAYATITQIVNDKRSLSRVCCDEPERTEEMARLLCVRGKELFSTPCDTSFFPSRKHQLAEALTKVRFVGNRTRRKLEAFAQTIPEVTTCLHGDFQTGNLILSGERHYWIDLDRFGYGDPMFDIGHLYLICNVYSPMRRVQNIFHMTHAQFLRFWDTFAQAYTGQADHTDFDRMAARHACLDIVLRYVFETPTTTEAAFFAVNIYSLVKKHFAS